MSSHKDQIESMKAEIEEKMNELLDFADKHDVSVTFRNFCGISRVTYVPENGIRPSVHDYWDGVDADEMPEEWDGEYAGWQNSSTFC